MIENYYELKDKISSKVKRQSHSFLDKNGNKIAIWIQKGNFKIDGTLKKSYYCKIVNKLNDTSKPGDGKFFDTKEELIVFITKEMKNYGFKEKKNPIKEIIYTDKIKDLSIEKLDEIINTNLESQEFSYSEILKVRKEKFKKEGQLKKEEVLKNIKLGDIFVYSWGYEQTNIDSYQVIEINGSMLTLREIGNKTIDITGPFSDTVKPVKDNFIGKEDEIIRKKINESGNISLNHGSGYLWNGKDTFHRSWGY